MVSGNHKDLYSNKQDSPQEIQVSPDYPPDNQSPNLDVEGGAPPVLTTVGGVKTVTTAHPRAVLLAPLDHL
jgi:hypothetical protein